MLHLIGSRQRHISPNSLLRWAYIVVLLVATTTPAAGPRYHVKLEDVVRDSAVIEVLYQALADEVNLSLALSILERFQDASDRILEYRDFIFELSNFQIDLRSRGLFDAVILEPVYSSAEWSQLGFSSDRIIVTHEALNRIAVVLNASQYGNDLDLWINILMARTHLTEFESGIGELKSAVSDLPEFIDRNALNARIEQLEEKLSYYDDLISDLEPEIHPSLPTSLLLFSNCTVVHLGQAVRFSGQLLTSAVGIGPLPDQTIELTFLGQTTHHTTNTQGEYNHNQTIPNQTTPGTYATQAYYNPPPETNLSGCSSNIVIITIQDTETPEQKNQTTISLRANTTTTQPGKNIQFKGELLATNTGPLPDQTIELTFLGQTTHHTTNTQGEYNHNQTIPNQTTPGTYAAQGSFNPGSESNLSPCRSNIVYVTVLGETELPTSLDIFASVSKAMTGEKIQIWGYLSDDWGRGLSNRTIWIRSPNLSSDVMLNTASDGSYATNLTLPSISGIFTVYSVFTGDTEYLPSSSPSLSIVVADSTVPLSTQITLSSPERAQAGKRILLSGRLATEDGLGIGLKEISIEWDGEPAWNATTGSDGSFSLSPKVPPEVSGRHTLRAIFHSDEVRYLSSTSKDIEIWVDQTSWITMILLMASLSIIAVGLAIARGRRPRILYGERFKEAATSVTKLEGPDAAISEPSSEPSGVLGTIFETSPDQPELTEKGKEPVIKAYVQLVQQISGLVMLDLKGKTHDEILSLILSKEIPQKSRGAAHTVSMVYEKAAFSQREPSANERRGFYESLDLLLSSLRIMEAG